MIISNKIQINSFEEFIKKVFFANLVLMSIDFLLYVFFDEPINSYYLNVDRFADFLKAADSLHIVKMWNGFNFYDYNLINKNIHHVVPPSTIFLWAVSSYIVKLGISKYIIYFSFFVLPFVILYSIRDKFINNSKYLYLLFFTYPILISIQRGNVATLVFFFLILSIIYSNKNKVLSIIYFIISVSFKVTPFVFVVQYFKNSKVNFLKIFLIIIISLITYNILIINIINKIVDTKIYNSLNFFIYLKSYNEAAIENLAGLRYGSSIYMPFITIIKIINENIFQSFIKLNSYLFNLFLITILLSISLIKNNILLLNNLFLHENKRLEFICISFILFMPVTADYYLLFLFIPLLLIPFHDFSFQKKICYFLLLLPKEIINTNIFIGKDLPIGAFINPILLTIILFDILKIFKFSEKLQKNRK
jgi:hypothetical protein